MYEVIIKTKTIEEKPAGKDWTYIEERPVTVEDIEEASYHEEQKLGELAKSFGLKKVYGYTPEIIKKKEVERTIYHQYVDELDLQSVIRAVNGME